MANEPKTAAASPHAEKRIRVIVVDDHAVVRRGLYTCLVVFDDLELVGEGTNGAEAISLCERLHPDVVLMDLAMPGINGIEATRRIVQQWPEIRIIALSSFGDEALVQDACRAGVISYLLKNVSPEKLAEAIRAAYAGQTTLAPEAAQALIRQPGAHEPSAHQLTDREKQVLALMVEGLNNVEIAERLCISRGTAKFHVHGVLAKLGVARRSQAVALALQEHLIS